MEQTYEQRLALLVENAFHTPVPCSFDSETSERYITPDIMRNYTQMSRKERLSNTNASLDEISDLVDSGAVQEGLGNLIEKVNEVHEIHKDQSSKDRDIRIMPIGLYSSIASRIALAEKGLVEPLNENDCKGIFEACSDYYRNILMSANEYFEEKSTAVDEVLQKKAELSDSEFHEYQNKTDWVRHSMDNKISWYSHVKHNCEMAGVDLSDIHFDSKFNEYYENGRKVRESIAKARKEQVKR